MVVRRGEHVELAHKTAAEWQAGEAEHEEPHRDAEERPLPAEAGEVVERHRHPELPLAGGDDGERAERRGRVGDEVVHERAAAERAAGAEPDEQEAGLRDRGVGQDPLHVPLHERREVADRQ